MVGAAPSSGDEVRQPRALAFDREQMKKMAALLASKRVFIGTSSWKYEVGSASFTRLQRYGYRGKFPNSAPIFRRNSSFIWINACHGLLKTFSSQPACCTCSNHRQRPVEDRQADDFRFCHVRPVSFALRREEESARRVRNARLLPFAGQDVS